MGSVNTAVKKTAAKKGGKKNRKFDRHSKRSPAAARYRAESRDEVNKKRKMAKHAKAVAAKAQQKKEMQNETAQ